MGFQKKGTWIAVGLAVCFYAAFLTIDLFLDGRLIHLSSLLKYGSLLCCVLISVLPSSDSAEGEKRKWLVVAMVVTAVADIFLLFTRRNSIGIAILRNTRSLKQPIACLLSASVLFAICSFGFRIQLDYSLAVSYAVMILGNTVFAFRNPYLDGFNRFLLRIGMILFLLCDISVALYNLAPPGSGMKRVVFPLMWLFYLPSQLGIALSGKHRYKKKLP